MHIGHDGRPKGSGIVAFESPADAANAIGQFNGYEWNGRMIEVREDRYAQGAPGAAGGFGGGRGGFGGGFGGRGGFGGPPRGGFAGRGGFGGGYGGGRGGFGGGYGGAAPGGAPAGGYDNAATASAPNPFTDNATSGGERSETIYVRNVSAYVRTASSSNPYSHGAASMVDQQRGSRRALHNHRQS